MGEEHFFGEGGVACRGDDLGGDASEVGVALAVGGMEEERDESGTGWDNVQAELAGEVVAEAGGAHFGDGDSAGGDDESGGAVFGSVSADGECGVATDFADFGVDNDFCVGVAAFGFEHGDDLSGGIVAEELAESFLVVCDSVFLDESDEIGGGVACEGGFGEVWICGEEMLRLGVKIREIAAASAGDEDFFADFFGAFEEDYAAAAFAGFDGAHQASGATAQNDYVEVEQPGPFQPRLELIPHLEFELEKSFLRG